MARIPNAKADKSEKAAAAAIEAVEVVAAAAKKVLYWAKDQKKYSFSIDVLDENGNRIPKKDSKNESVWQNGRQIWESRIFEFRNVNSQPGTFLCVFEWSSEMPQAVALREKLEALVASSNNSVMSDYDFKRSLNTEAFDARIAVAEKDEKISSLEDQLAKVRAELAAASRKGGSDE